MRMLIPFLLLASIVLPARAQTDPCATAPKDAILQVPIELSDWLHIVCLKTGHEVAPSPKYLWVTARSGQQITFAAIGTGRSPANVIQGTPLVVGRTGAYAPLVDGGLMSPHDATFQKARVTPMTGALLAEANKAAATQTGFGGPYPSGYLYDLLSNQGFQYRLYILANEAGPQTIFALTEMPKVPSKAVVVRILPAPASPPTPTEVGRN